LFFGSVSAMIAKDMKTDVCITGAGPAGLFAAISAAQSGVKTIVVERNTTAGRKLLRTARGRCNITHTGSVEDFVKVYGPCGRFLKHSLYEFSAENLREYLDQKDLKTIAEKNGFVFPISNRASDVAEVLVEDALKQSVRFLYGQSVTSVEKTADGFEVLTDKEKISTNAVIIATGGVTWPFTGSTGDGYNFAKAFGHTIAKPKASLTSLITTEKWPAQLAGVGLEKVVIKTKIANRKLCARGPLMFTSSGIGGPAVFDISRAVTEFLPNYKNPLKITIDTLPDWQSNQLENKIIALCTENPKKDIASILTQILPKSFISNLCKQIEPSKLVTAGQLTKTQRKQLVMMLKQLTVSITATGPIDEAHVTQGGVSTAEIDPKTMQSKLCNGLYFAGEVINVDGPCGGYNLQIAFSTGHLAGTSAAKCQRQ